MELLKLVLLPWLMANAVAAYNTTTALKTLFTDLLTDYDIRLRPVSTPHQPVVIMTYCEPTVVLDLDTATQRFILSASFSFTWNDVFLHWTLTNPDDVSKVWLPVTEIWHPVVVLIWPYDGRVNVGHSDDLVAVTNTGGVSWTAEGVYDLVCQADIEFYPFDTQECEVFMYINDLPRSDVMLIPAADGINKTMRMENPEWRILDMTAEAQLLLGAQGIQYKFLFRRRSAFVMYTMIGPLLILAFLNAAAFLIPIESGEKGSVVMTILLAFCVNMSSTSTLLPPNSLKNTNLLIFMMVLSATSAATAFYTMLQSYCFHSDGTSLLPLTALKRITCFRKRPKVVTPEADDIPKLKDEIRDDQEEKTINKNRYRGIDVLMFCLSLLLNVIVMVVFVNKARSSFRDTLV